CVSAEARRHQSWRSPRHRNAVPDEAYEVNLIIARRCAYPGETMPSPLPAVRAGAGDLDHRQGGREAGAAGGSGEQLGDRGGGGLAHRPATLADQERDHRIRAMVAAAGDERIPALDPVHQAIEAQEVE